MSHFALLRFFCKNPIHSCLGFVFSSNKKKRTISDALPNLNLKTHERNKSMKTFLHKQHLIRKKFIYSRKIKSNDSKRIVF